MKSISSNISFFIPAYNCADTLEESVCSILNENFESGDEIIIVNDYSTDNTESVIEKLKINFPFFKTLRHDINKGGAATRNTAISHANNPLLFCLDSDNILASGSIKNLKKFLINSDADIAAFQEVYFFIDNKDNIVNKWVYQDQITLVDVLSRHDVPGASGNYLFTKESWQRAGGYPEFAGALDTHGFGFRQLATGSKMVTMPNSYYYHRQGIESYYVRFSKKQNLSLTFFEIIAPFSHLIFDYDWEYICGKGKETWYDNIPVRPINLKTKTETRQNLKMETQACFIPYNIPENFMFTSTNLVPGEIQLIEKFINQGDIVFDVGAYVGEWTREVVEKSSNLEVHLFEPNPKAYTTLVNNLTQLNISQFQLIPQNMGVGCQEGVQTFYRYGSLPVLSTLYRRVAVEQQGLQTPEAFTILTTTLDQYCQRQAIERINFLKIDVGGGELDVLKGAETYLKKGKIDYIQFEYGGTYLDAKTTLKEVFNYLHKFQYVLFKIEGKGLQYKPDFDESDENYEYSNYLAVNDRFRGNVLGEPPQMLDIPQLCRQHSIKPRGIIHVGAHEGGEVGCYQAMEAQKVLFIEANPLVFERLQANIAAYSNVKAVNYAISNQNGTINLHVTSFDQSSSILPLKHHQDIYPDIVETHQITVESRTLDTLLRELDLNPADFNILNIDIQGAELLALKGATHWLQYVEAINTEVNYKELYEGCALIDDLDEFLERYGFERVATVTHHPDWGDAFYVKRPVISMATLHIARFGNQIFDYAFLKIYAEKHNLRLELPVWSGQYLFGHNDLPISKPLPDIIGVEQTVAVAEQVILTATEPLKNVDFRGYFQLQTQYYAKYKNFFRSLFKPIPGITTKMEKAMNQLRARGKTIVGIHLRRGDYKWAGNQNPYLRIAPSEWYLDWLKGFWETLDHPVLFIASDEIEEVVGDFSDYQPVTTQDLGVEISEVPFYPDFYILSQCDILAISNSTFSFAASMLNERCKFFFRPHLYAQKLIPYDPWNSEPLLRYTSSQAAGSQSLTQAIVEEVVQLLPWNPEILYGFNLDYPQVGQAIYREVFVSGWVIAKKSPVTHVELIVEGQSIEIIPVQGERPDVAHILSGIPGAESSGFSKHIDITNLSSNAKIDVQAVLQDQTRTNIAAIQLKATQTPEQLKISITSKKNRTKCTLSICAILKDEAPYLIEWLEFHQIVGVERFYLYDNSSSDHAKDLVESYIKSGVVVWHEWPIIQGQLPAYKHCLQNYQEETEWVAFIDLDEFLFPTEDDDLRKVLEDYRDYPAVVVNWLVFGSSGHQVRPEGLQIENFTKRAVDEWETNKHIKSIVCPKNAICPQEPHSFIYLDNQLAVTENKQSLFGPWSETHSVKRLRINHYTIRSLQEYQEKINRGIADFDRPRVWAFEAYDRNEVEDLTIQRFVPQLKQAVNWITARYPIVQILIEQWQLKKILYQKQEDLKQFQFKCQQAEEQFNLSEIQLEQMQQEAIDLQEKLHHIKEELERSQSQFDEVLAELEEAHWQLHQGQLSQTDLSV